ncbi:hypothetical protein BC826DRAFT_186245 [Russula brevipes]|nr:hypothetical protein BC826DRAFT_186245 [Russula brevipes]
MLPGKILEVVEHASDGNQYPADVRQRRCRACLTALYFLPGAVHDILSAFRHASCPPQASLPVTLKLWRIAAKLSPHIDDDVALGARCVAVAIATKTTFSAPRSCAAMRATSRSSCPSSASQHSYLAGTGNGEDIRLANLVSFVWLTVKLVRNMEASLRALTTAQRNVILSERERLREVRSTRSWDFAETEKAIRFRRPHRSGYRRPSPWRPITLNHGLLRLKLKYLSDPGLFDRRRSFSATSEKRGTTSRRCNATLGLSATAHTALS